MSPTLHDKEGRGYALQAALHDRSRLGQTGNVFVLIGKGSEITRESRLYFSPLPNPDKETYLFYVPTFYAESTHRGRITRCLTPYAGPLPLRPHREDDETASLLQQSKGEEPPRYAWRSSEDAIFPSRLHPLDEGRKPHGWADARLVLGHDIDTLLVKLNAS